MRLHYYHAIIVIIICRFVSVSSYSEGSGERVQVVKTLWGEEGGAAGAGASIKESACTSSRGKSDGCVFSFRIRMESGFHPPQRGGLWGPNRWF